MKLFKDIPDRARPYLKTPLISVSLAILFAGLYTLTFFTPVPWALHCILHALYYGSFVFLLGTTYGILNDIFACNGCVEYFTELHNPGNLRMGRVIPTDDKLANAYIWGILATNGLSIMAGTVFGVAMLIMNFAGLPLVPYMMIALAAGVVLSAIGAHIFSHFYKKQLKSDVEKAIANDTHHYARYHYENETNPFSGNPLPKEKVIEWYGNGARNGFGYTAMPLLAVVSLIVTISLKAAHVTVPALAMTLPLHATVVGIPIALLLIGLIYFSLYYNHQTKQPAHTQQVKTVAYNTERAVDFDNTLTLSPQQDLQIGALKRAQSLESADDAQHHERAKAKELEAEHRANRARLSHP